MKNFKADEPCVVCGLNIDGMVCYHHIYSRKAHPEFNDSICNMIPVCQKHHNEFHNKGNKAMFLKHPGVYSWMTRHGWEIQMGKLVFDVDIEENI